MHALKLGGESNRQRAMQAQKRRWPEGRGKITGEMNCVKLNGRQRIRLVGIEKRREWTEAQQVRQSFCCCRFADQQSLAVITRRVVLSGFAMIARISRPPFIMMLLMIVTTVRVLVTGRGLFVAVNVLAGKKGAAADAVDTR